MNGFNNRRNAAHSRRSSPFGRSFAALCICALNCWAVSLQAAPVEIPDATFDAANKLYEQGKFTGAAAAFEKLAQSGRVSAALYFNLGNAFFKAGQLGRAIRAYDMAEQINPRDPDLRANLQFARNQVQGPTLAPGWQERWLDKLSLNEWTCLAAGAVWVWLLLLSIQQWLPRAKPALRGWIPPAGLASGLLCACMAVVWARHSRHEAIVVAREAVVRQAPLLEAQTSFSTHDGAELRVLDSKGDWLQVSPDPQRIGWVRKDQVLLAPGA
ncbi:MAG TPA: tetratricopeptide repeat protein [Verrucomicrobiae bacterium]|nr:tetratricopeptide repeat protein [Verrucomicrobiae bacterium]